jgi:predicted negative regulator of RcsB-dependent stress response
MRSEVEQLPLADRLWAWFETNKTQAAAGIVVFLVIALIVSFVIWRRDQQASRAGEALSAVMLGPVTSPNVRPPSADEFLKMASEYPDSTAAARAIVMAASDYFVDGKFEDARIQFERFTRDHRDSPFMGQALLGVAACLDAEGKTNEAVTAYKDLIDRHPGEAVLPQARFSLACLYEALNQPEKARPLFEDVWREDSGNSIRSEAGMRLEELSIKFPSLMSPVPASTNPVPYKIEKK